MSSLTSSLGRRGPKHLTAAIWNLQSSREMLLEAVADGLSRTKVGDTPSAGGRSEWQPWKMLHEVVNGPMTMTSNNGHELVIPALSFSSRTRVTDTQKGVNEAGGSRTFVRVTTVTVEAAAGYSQPIDEYTILLRFTADPGWMSWGSEVLVYESVVAVREALCKLLKMDSRPMFRLGGGGWENIGLSTYGTLI